MFRSSRERISWFAITILLGLQFHVDLLGLLVPRYKDHFQSDSDRYIYLTLSDGQRALLDPLMSIRYEYYESQFGLQGIVMAAVSPGNSLYGAMRVVSALLLAAVVATAVIACWRAWGGRAASVLLVLLTASTWLNAFGHSTYWQLWTMLLPTLVPLLLWPRMGAGRRKWIRGGALIAGLVCLKALCGYEYITAVVAGAVAAVAFHEFRGRIDRGLLARLLGAGVSGAIGFVLALAVHVVQLISFYGSTAAFGARVAERTTSPRMFEIAVNRARGEEDPVLGRLVEGDSSIGLWTYRMIGYLRDPALSIPTVHTNGHEPVPAPFGLPIYLFVILFAVLAWQAYRNQTPDGLVERRLALATGIGFLGAMSWMVLGYGHMINHPHIEAIVFYIPFLPLLFAMIALRVETHLRRKRQPHATGSVPAADAPRADAPRAEAPRAGGPTSPRATHVTSEGTGRRAPVRPTVGVHGGPH